MNYQSSIERDTNSDANNYDSERVLPSIPNVAIHERGTIARRAALVLGACALAAGAIYAGTSEAIHAIHETTVVDVSGIQRTVTGSGEITSIEAK